MNAAELLGLPLIPAYSQASNSGDQMVHGVNFASAASGILDITGRNFVSFFRRYQWRLYMGLFLICLLVRLSYISRNKYLQFLKVVHVNIPYSRMIHIFCVD